MLKTALFDCAINEKCCGVDGGRGICRLFSSQLREIWQLKSPQSREFAIQGKKKCSCLGLSPAGGGGGGGRAVRSWNWLMHHNSIKLKFLRALTSWIVLFPQKGAWSWKASQYIACARLSVSVDGRKKRTRSERNAAKKNRRFVSPLLTRFLHFFNFDPFSLSFLEPGTGYTTQINALIHVTLALCHLTPVDSAMEESSESESDLPVFEIQRWVTVTLMVFFLILAGLF